MTIRVLTDYAHNDLWHSMHLLFVARFGWELYRPIGMEWYDEGIWRFERDRVGDIVAKQFLQEWPDDWTMPGMEGDEPGLDHSWRKDPAHPGYAMRMVTLEQARAMDFDLVIATLAENEEGLHRFAREVGAKYGIQVGNQGAPNQWGLCDFALLTVTTPGFRPWMPHVTYHQEFSLEDYRYEWPPRERDLVSTRVQCFAGTDRYGIFRNVAQMVPEARFRHFGHCGDRDDLWGGDSPTVPEIAQSMVDTRVAWHDKRWSDGYGHVIHGWFAVGRPVVVSSRYYTGESDRVPKLAGALMDPAAIIDIDAYTDSELAFHVKHLLQDDDLHLRMSEAARARFDAVVNFDAEAEEIRTMLEGVLS